MLHRDNCRTCFAVSFLWYHGPPHHVFPVNKKIVTMKGIKGRKVCFFVILILQVSCHVPLVKEKIVLVKWQPVRCWGGELWLPGEVSAWAEVQSTCQLVLSWSLRRKCVSSSIPKTFTLQVWIGSVEWIDLSVSLCSPFWNDRIYRIQSGLFVDMEWCIIAWIVLSTNEDWSVSGEIWEFPERDLLQEMDLFDSMMVRNLTFLSHCTFRLQEQHAYSSLDLSRWQLKYSNFVKIVLETYHLLVFLYASYNP